MNFETNADVLNWYERQERALTPKFIESLPWHEVSKYPLEEKFVPILYYMRDIETLTDMYHREMLRTPTGKDPHISKFMERWGVEEITHGEVINRFLGEMGYDYDEDWQTQVRRSITWSYRANTYLMTTLTNLVGRQFTGTHMTFGAIHEMETAQGYRRLRTLTSHPVLKQILAAIIREESAHTQFYWSVARLELRNNTWAQKMARFVAEHFWAPVGQASVGKKRAEYLVTTLFGDIAGMEKIEKITHRVRALPGFSDINKITEKVDDIVRRGKAANAMPA